MALDEADKQAIGVLIAAALAPIAQSVSPEALAKTITPVIEAQLGAKGVLTKAELDKRDADAKAAADAAKAASDDEAAKKSAADAAAKAGGKQGDPVKDPAVAELERQIAALTKANEDSARKAADAESARKADALHGAARDALIKAGIPADRVHLALPALKEAGVLAYDGDRAGWKGLDPKTNVPAVLDMAEGVKSWITADGKHFLPPVGASGTGGDPNAGRRDGPNAAASSVRVDGKIDATRALNKFLGG